MYACTPSSNVQKMGNPPFQPLMHWPSEADSPAGLLNPMVFSSYHWEAIADSGRLIALAAWPMRTTGNPLLIGRFTRYSGVGLTTITSTRLSGDPTASFGKLTA